MIYEYLIVKPEDYCDKNGARDSHFWIWPSCLEVLSKYGKDGWELCWFGDSQYWFKRAVVKTTTPEDEHRAHFK